MKEKFLPFILKFTLVSLVLFALWHWKGEYYYFIFFFFPIVPPILYFLGLKFSPVRILIPFFHNFLPFISLILITRGIKIQARFQKLLFGLFLIFLWQVLLAEILFLIFGQTKDPTTIGLVSKIIYLSFLLLNWCIPFILWLILARKSLYNWFISK